MELTKLAFETAKRHRYPVLPGNGGQLLGHPRAAGLDLPARRLQNRDMVVSGYTQPKSIVSRILADETLQRC